MAAVVWIAKHAVVTTLDEADVRRLIERGGELIALPQKEGRPDIHVRAANIDVIYQQEEIA